MGQALSSGWGPGGAGPACGGGIGAGHSAAQPIKPSLLHGQSGRVASPTAHTTSRGPSLPSAFAQNPQAPSLSPPGAAAKVYVDSAAGSSGVPLCFPRQ